MKSDRILERIKSGKPLDHIPIIDMHTHMGGSSRFYYVPYHDPQHVISYFSRYGVDHVLTFALSTTTDPHVKNKAIYGWHEAYPDKFSVLTTLHAGFPQDWMELLEEGAVHGSRGIKLLADYQGVDELSIDWSQAFEYARDKNWVVLHHDWRSEEHLEYYAKNFPSVTFIIGHPTMRFSGRKNILSAYDNVYQCTCASFVMPGFSLLSIEDMYNELPLEKILYGSDALDLDLGTAIGSIAYAGIPEDAKEKILGKNALELSKKLGWKLNIY